MAPPALYFGVGRGTARSPHPDPASATVADASGGGTRFGNIPILQRPRRSAAFKIVKARDTIRRCSGNG